MFIPCPTSIPDSTVNLDLFGFTFLFRDLRVWWGLLLRRGQPRRLLPIWLWWLHFWWVFQWKWTNENPKVRDSSFLGWPKIKPLLYNLLTLYTVQWKGNIYCISRPPREARQPRLGPWLDFEKYKMLTAVVAHHWSGRHYGVLACQKSTVAALFKVS